MTTDPTQPGGGRAPDLLGPEEDTDIPPPPHGLERDPLDERSQARLATMSSRRGRLLPAVLVVGAIGVFVGIVWWAYQTANETPESPAEVPVVAAEPGEPKVRPESEGGMDVPNQDKLIYEQLGQADGQPGVERLLPPPEEPLEPPAPPPPAEPEVDTSDLTPPPPPQEISPSQEIAQEQAAPPDMEATVAPDPDAAVPQQEDTAAAQPDEPEGVAPGPEDVPVQEEPPAPAEAPAPAPAEEPVPEQPSSSQVAAAGGGFRIQLAAVKSEADARTAWDRLQKAHPDLLGGLQPTIQRADLGEQGIFYRVQGGPLPSREAAAALCEGLEAKNQACLVVKP